MKYKIGIDMGGTTTKTGLLKGLEIIDRSEIPTEISKGVTNYVDRVFNETVRLLRKNGLDMADVESIGMGIPGNLNRDTGMVEYANNLNFENVPLQDIMADRFGCPVLLDNDANIAALGEYVLSGSKASSFIMVTLGTGIGGGIILNGELYRGINFAEGELGHMTIKYDGISCNCGRKGCFEAYASTNALVKMACDAMKNNPGSALWKISKIDGKAFFDAVRAGDRSMQAVLDEYTTYLAEGLANIINIFQPEELVIGGGISAVADLFLPQTSRKIHEKIYTRNSVKNTEIRAAKYGNDAALTGAALLK